VANAAIKPNVCQFGKELTPDRKSGSKPVLATCGDAVGAARLRDSAHVGFEREEGTDLNKDRRCSTARTSPPWNCRLQLDPPQYIPFSINQRHPLFIEAGHLKDLTAYLKLVTNPTR